MDVNVGFWILASVVAFLLVALRARRQQKPLPWIYILFFSSGFPALIYQIVWQRALFAMYGLSIQSVTIIVSAFMLGLGLGSLAGGLLSRTRWLQPVTLFALAEFGTAVFGVMSLRLFHCVAGLTVGSSPAMIGLATFLLIVIPTLLMGATLPLLVEQVARSSKNMGSSVGGLYFVNTLGSGLACFVAAGVLMRLLGQSGSVRVAASINALVGTGALIYNFYSTRAATETSSRQRPIPPDLSQPRSSLLPFPIALSCAAFCGFAALAYEIIWYRLLAFAAEDTARVFASLLGSYLFGLALGARATQRYSERHPASGYAANVLSGLILASAILAFAICPAFAFGMKFISPDSASAAAAHAFSIVLLLICIGAFVFGAIFPLIAHVSVDPVRHAGAALSLLYAANIVGSTLGSFVVGFILMDRLSIFSISLILLAGGVLCATVVLAASGRSTQRLRLWSVSGLALAALVAIGSRPVFGTIYDRVLFKNQYPNFHFEQVVEGRSGTIGVTPVGVVFGGGVYDGRFNVDLMHDTNIITRPYALSLFHGLPRHVLMIGLGSGSWAQIVANHPQVEELTVVEINPGYVKLISQYPAVASLLRNPKVRITIDDGRRWLVRHPGRNFDAIVMNTTFYWRNHASNLLSVDFLRITREHLDRGGVFFYNTTGSEEVMSTGLAVYPHARRFVNCLAVSDSPIEIDRARWKAVLLSYVIDGKHVIDPDDPKQMAKLDEVVSINEDPTGRLAYSMENEDQLRQRLRGRKIITDDNMLTEWR